MKLTRIFALVIVLVLLFAAGPAWAGLSDLQQQLQTRQINFEANTSTQGGIINQGSSDNFFQSLMDFFKQFFQGIMDAFRNGTPPVQPPVQPPVAPPTNPPVAPPAPPVAPPVTPPVAPPTTPPTVEPPTTTPPTVNDNEVPTGVAALKQAIQQKFGVRMIDGRRRWTEAQLRAVYKTLAVLPEKFRKWNRSMTRDGNRGGIAGMGQIGGSGMIWMYDGAFGRSNSGTGIGTIVHEITHNFQGNREVCNLWTRSIRGRSCTSYGNTNWKEDMAESVKYYYLYGAKLKQTHASRYEFIKKHIMNGVEFKGDEWQ